MEAVCGGAEGLVVWYQVCNIDARGRVLNLAYTAHVGAAAAAAPTRTARQALEQVRPQA
jgi:hypothetical protein